MYGCCVPYLNLLGEEIRNMDILKPIAEVHNFFRNRQVLHGRLKEKNIFVPHAACEKRGNSQAIYVTTYIRKLPSLT